MESIVVKRPGHPAETKEVADVDIKTLQELVGGYVEIIKMDGSIKLAMNEDGKLKKLPPNCRFPACEVVGTVVAIRVARRHFSGLDAEQTQWATDQLNLYAIRKKSA